MRGIIKLPEAVSIKSSASIVGKLENEGPLGKYFDMHEDDLYFGQDSWEKAESEMSRRTLGVMLGKIGRKYEDVDLIVAGDLLNQCIASSFGILESGAPFLGLYGACSTFAESIITGSALCAAGYIENCAAMASSHFCTSERQFRFPVEYGGQRTPTSQSTVTGCGGFFLERGNEPPFVTECVIGKITDAGIKDQNNMGAAMAPAAADTILRYFNSSGRSPSEFDIIVTGDLGQEGHELADEIIKNNGLDLGDKFKDCGFLIYDLANQDVKSGGSGCGCSATVTASYFMDMLKNGWNDILVIGTGALLSPVSVFQKQNIPSVAHLVHISNKNPKVGG